MSSQQVDARDVAVLLKLRRSLLESLITAGHLGEVVRTADGRRLVLLSRVLEYRERRRSRRIKAMARLTELTEETGLYEIDRVGPERERRDCHRACMRC